MRTVFVIGAGANTEIGMPSGNELKFKIAELLNFSSANSGGINGDKLIYSTISLYSRDGDCVNSDRETELINAAINISKAMPLSISIDNYIEAHKNDLKTAFCGKLAITRAILNSEQSCAMFHVYEKSLLTPVILQERIEQFNKSWYPLFFQKITEGCRVDELAERLGDVSFIIFNYDRCFEYFMYKALMVYYNISHDEARNFVQNLHISHPYGTVGNLWDNKGKCTFGDSPDSTQLIHLAQKIKTFTESRELEKVMEYNVQYLVERADRIIFLGFAYYEQNIDLLFKNKGEQIDTIPLSENTVCYGTGYQISEDDMPLIRNSLILSNKKIKGCYISDIKCAQFFRDFWYRLSFKPAQTDQDRTIPL